MHVACVIFLLHDLRLDKSFCDKYLQIFIRDVLVTFRGSDDVNGHA